MSANYLMFTELKDKTFNNILKTGFFSRDTSHVARDLLGKILVKKNKKAILTGLIVETEAYYGKDDPASHAYRGKTMRSKVMFGRAGIAYVYLCYGMYCLLNVVTEEQEKPGAVLIRSVMPLNGLELMRRRRTINNTANLCNGPGKLTVAFRIGLDDNGKDFTDPGCDLNICDFEFHITKSNIFTSQRIGINAGKDRLLRFYTNIKL